MSIISTEETKLSALCSSSRWTCEASTPWFLYPESKIRRLKMKVGRSFSGIMVQARACHQWSYQLIAERLKG
jgi:hypothetical protein